MSKTSRKQELKPTGTCFDDTLDFLEQMSKLPDARLALPQLLLVHGICITPTTKDRLFAHAWIEWPKYSMVLQGCIYKGKRRMFETPKVVFYAQLRPQKFTRYTIFEAAKLNEEHNNYGPWVDEYIALCKDAS